MRARKGQPPVGLVLSGTRTSGLTLSDSVCTFSFAEFGLFAAMKSLRLVLPCQKEFQYLAD